MTIYTILKPLKLLLTLSILMMGMASTAQTLSNKTINYDDWTYVLANTVMRVGASNRFKGKHPKGPTATRLSLANPNPSWLEGNRVYFEKLTEEQISSLVDYRTKLEAIPNTTPLSEFSRDEQLAYWLNLYNMTVYIEIANRYPVTSLKRLRKKGLWDQKLLNVEQKALSLNDIQEILIKNWESPLVIYGLFQGSIGGPNILKRAFTGQSVWGQLRTNAEDFINSIRGTHKKGKYLRVSKFYDWTKNAFPDFEKDLLRHINEFADKKTMEIINRTSNIKAGYYDWHITDLYNGYPKQVRIYASTVTYPNSGQTIGYDLLAPLHAQSLVENLVVKFKTFGFPNTNVTIDEVKDTSN